MKQYLIVIFCLFLLACDKMKASQSSNYVELDRGVAGGASMGSKNLNALRQHGIVLADSREGTSVIIPADKVFVEQVDRVVINPEFQPVLNELVTVLKAYPEIKLSVIGHTDGVMSRALEAQQSDAYAQAIANYLTIAGISATRIDKVGGVGSRQPIVDDSYNKFEERQVNRRVEVVTSQPLR